MATQNSPKLLALQNQAATLGMLVIDSSTSRPLYQVFFEKQLVGEARSMKAVSEALPHLYRAIQEQLAEQQQVAEVAEYLEQQAQEIAPEPVGISGDNVAVALQPVKTATCNDCPQFQSFGEESGRGYCPCFDKVVRSHHQQTAGCDHPDIVPQPAVPAANTDGTYTTLSKRNQAIAYITNPAAGTCTCKAGQFKKACSHLKEATDKLNALVMEFRNADTVEIQSGMFAGRVVTVERPIPGRGVVVYIPRSRSAAGHSLLVPPSNLKKVTITTQLSDVDPRAIAIMKAWNPSQNALDAHKRK